MYERLFLMQDKNTMCMICDDVILERKCRPDEIREEEEVGLAKHKNETFVCHQTVRDENIGKNNFACAKYENVII